MLTWFASRRTQRTLGKGPPNHPRGTARISRSGSPVQAPEPRSIDHSTKHHFASNAPNDHLRSSRRSWHSPPVQALLPKVLGPKPQTFRKRPTGSDAFPLHNVKQPANSRPKPEIKRNSLFDMRLKDRHWRLKRRSGGA